MLVSLALMYRPEESRNCQQLDSFISSREQMAVLEETFEKSHYLDTVSRNELSKQLNLNSNVITIWFQNRRAKSRRKNKRILCESDSCENFRFFIFVTVSNCLSRFSANNSRLPSLVSPLCPSEISSVVDPASEITGFSKHQPLIQQCPSNFDSSFIDDIALL